MSDNLLYTPCSHDNMPDTCVTCLQNALATAGEQLAQMRAALHVVSETASIYGPTESGLGLLKPHPAYDSLTNAIALTPTKAERIATTRAKVCEVAWSECEHISLESTCPFCRPLSELRAAEAA